MAAGSVREDISARARCRLERGPVDLSAVVCNLDLIADFEMRSGQSQ